MDYRAFVKKSGGWWIGWLVDVPGVNAQEKTREEVIESLRVGAQDMLTTQVPFDPESTMVVIDVPDPEWVAGAAP